MVSRVHRHIHRWCALVLLVLRSLCVCVCAPSSLSASTCVTISPCLYTPSHRYRRFIISTANTWRTAISSLLSGPTGTRCGISTLVSYHADGGSMHYIIHFYKLILYLLHSAYPTSLPLLFILHHPPPPPPTTYHSSSSSSPPCAPSISAARIQHEKCAGMGDS